MGKDTLKYIFVCMTIYLSMSAIEIFLLNPVVDFIAKGYRGRLIVYLVLLLAVNPALTRLLADRFNWKEPARYGDDL